MVGNRNMERGSDKGCFGMGYAGNGAIGDNMRYNKRPLTSHWGDGFQLD